MHKWLFLAILTLAVTACDNYPKDPHNTLHKIKETRKVRIGVIEHPPWAVKINGTPAGPEPALAEAFAATLGAQPEWRFYSEAAAAHELEKGGLDLVIGGLTEASPRKKQIAFTRPYQNTGNKLQNPHVLAVRKGENRFLITLEKYLKKQGEQYETGSAI